MTIRIGILCNRERPLAYWERRLFDRITDDHRFEIVALFVDGRPDGVGMAPSRDAGLDFDLPRRALLWLLDRVDSSVVERPDGAGAQTFAERFGSIPIVEMLPARRGAVDTFAQEDADKIRALGIDVLLRHAFGIIHGPVLEAPRFGIWSFHHGDNAVNRGGPPGFWEAANGEPVTGATLQVLTPELDGGRVIARNWVSTQPNAVRNRAYVLDASVSLLLRELGKLARTGRLVADESPLYSGPLYRQPTFAQAARYGMKRLGGALKGVTNAVLPASLQSRNRWHIAVGRGPFETAALWRTKEVVAPAGRWWADPFLHEKDGVIYVLFEEFDEALDKAHIAAGRLAGHSIEYLGKVLEADYHMSFPQIVEHEGTVFMVPETFSNNRVEVWRSGNFPFDWTLHATALEGQTVADAVLGRHDGQWWLFANISQTYHVDCCNELHVFAVDGPDLRSVVPHENNPVVIDSQTARNAGRIFHREGRLFRPSQMNIANVYGYGLNIMEIKELSLSSYREERRLRATPDFKRGIVGVHHLDILGDIFVIDVCRRTSGLALHV